MDFTPGQQKLLLWWGNIVNSVFQRASTAELWDAVRQAAANEGNDLSGVRLTDMNGLRSIAARQRVSMGNLMSGRPDQVIGPGMIGTDLSSRGLAEQAAAPKFIARFEHDVLINGQLETFWRSSTIDGPAPTTVGDLRSSLEQDAQALADDYDVTHVGIGRMMLVAV